MEYARWRRGSPHSLRASVSRFPERWRLGHPAAPHPSPAVTRAATPAVQSRATEAEWLRNEDKKGACGVPEKQVWRKQKRRKYLEKVEKK